MPVCANQRIHQHKTFAHCAGRGKSSTGWFYGLKLHLVINQYGQIINFLISSAQVSDNNKEVLQHLFQTIKGKCYAEKGYLSQFFEEFYQQGVQIITKIRSNMKNKLLRLEDKIRLKKKSLD